MMNAKPGKTHLPSARGLGRVYMMGGVNPSNTHPKPSDGTQGAIDIQRIFRGKLGRRVVFKIRHAEEELLRDAAALAVQRVYRGHLGRVVAKKAAATAAASPR